ncbi:MAG: DUF1329 domain-containing protein [Candidatus Binataceae bacterium]
MKTWVTALLVCALMALPTIGRAQSSTDITDLQQFLKSTEKQGPVPASGTKITQSNWRQYKQFMPFGMVMLFEGKYQWKMPQDVEMDIGPVTHHNLPQTFLAATEKYGAQDRVEHLPNGHYQIDNYQGGIPFPNPQDPYKGYKMLANVFFAYTPAIVVSTPDNKGSIWFQDRFHNISRDTFSLVYRQSGYNTDPGVPVNETYAPGTWYTEWFMEESPEQARYTASLALFYKDMEAHPFPDQYVFVPALRRSLRLSSSARCAPIFGSDWTNDDAKLNGFNGSTSIYTADWLSDRDEVELLAPAMKAGWDFPHDYSMPLGFPKPDWGKWQIRPVSVIDVHRIPSEASGYCYGDRVMYLDREVWSTFWNDNFDSNHKLWKAFAYENAYGPGAGMKSTWVGIAAMAWDLQNTHETIWSSWGNKNKRSHYLDSQVPKQYLNGVKYGSPSGLMQIMR